MPEAETPVPCADGDLLRNGPRMLDDVFEALATDPLAPAPGENSYLYLPPDPPLHRMRALTDQSAARRSPAVPGS